MNKRRRNEVKEVCAKLQAIRDELDDIRSDEQDAYDNIPEGLSESEAAEESGEAIDAMESATDDIEAAIETLEELL